MVTGGAPATRSTAGGGGGGCSGAACAPAGGADGAEALGRQLARQRERCDALCAALRTLVRVNAEFLHQAAVVRTGDLSDYLRALEDSLRPCERLLAE